MTSSGSLPFHALKLLLVAVLALAGLYQCFTSAGHMLLGVLLLCAASGLAAHARNSRAAHLHRQKMTGLSTWALGLGPRRGKGRA